PRGTPPENVSQPNPSLKGSNPGGIRPVLRPSAWVVRPLQSRGNGRRAFRGRCPRLLSGALSGHEKPPGISATTGSDEKVREEILSASRATTLSTKVLCLQ